MKRPNISFVIVVFCARSSDSLVLPWTLALFVTFIASLPFIFVVGRYCSSDCCHSEQKLWLFFAAYLHCSVNGAHLVFPLYPSLPLPLLSLGITKAAMTVKSLLIPFFFDFVSFTFHLDHASCNDFRSSFSTIIITERRRFRFKFHSPA